MAVWPLKGQDEVQFMFKDTTVFVNILLYIEYTFCTENIYINILTRSKYDEISFKCICVSKYNLFM